MDWSRPSLFGKDRISDQFTLSQKLHQTRLLCTGTNLNQFEIRIHIRPLNYTIWLLYYLSTVMQYGMWLVLGNSVLWVEIHNAAQCRLLVQSQCIGIYSSSQLHRHVVGNHWDMVANIKASDSSCWCIWKIIPGDLRLVVGWLYEIAVTQPRATYNHYLFPSCCFRPLPLNKL